MTQIFLNEWAESRKKSAKRMKERSFGRKRSSRQPAIVKKPRTLNKDNPNPKSNARDFVPNENGNVYAVYTFPCDFV